MKQKEITICGKQVTLAYCYATEISYKILSDEDITDFFKAAGEKITKEQMPDPYKTIFVILAAMTSYYESRGEKAPVTDKELMYHATAEEIGTALGTVMGLRAEFYHVAKDEPEDKKDEKEADEKNA